MALHVLDEANRCLGCKKPMCQEGCPIHTNIPEVIRLLKANQMDDAGRMLFENNPLTTVCSLVCNHEKQCEGHCIRNRMPSHDPVHFSIIEDYISTTYANKMTAGPAPKNGMKAAVGVDKRNICSRRKRIQADLRTSQGELFMKLRPIFFSNCHFCVACHCKHLHFDSQSFIACAKYRILHIQKQVRTFL